MPLIRLSYATALIVQDVYFQAMLLRSPSPSYFSLQSTTTKAKLC